MPFTSRIIEFSAVSLISLVLFVKEFPDDPPPPTAGVGASADVDTLKLSPLTSLLIVLLDARIE